MSSDMILPVTAQEPIEGELNVLTMDDEQIQNLISATHVPADHENFDADSVFVDVKNTLKGKIRMVDNVLTGDEELENLEEESEEELENLEEESEEERDDLWEWENSVDFWEWKNLEEENLVASLNMTPPGPYVGEEELENLEEKLSRASSEVEEDLENLVSRASFDPLLGTLHLLSSEGEEELENLEEESEEELENLEEESEEELENLEEKLYRASSEVEEDLESLVSRASFDPLLGTLHLLSSEMACKAPGVEIAHKTTMSILDKLSSYSWNDKALLTLAAFAMRYEYFLAPAQHHPSHQLSKSAEISAILKNLDLKKYGKTIGKLNTIIYFAMQVMDYIFWLKELCTNKYIKEDTKLLSNGMGKITVGAYWIIITVAACTAHMCCLTSDENKTPDLYPFAKRIRQTDLISLACTYYIFRIERETKRRKLKEVLQMPDEIMEVFKALIFPTDDIEPLLLEGSSNKAVSIDVLKKKDVLLFISSLDISIDDISILIPIYYGIKKKGDQYKIVWIPIVEQWTSDLQKKFEMLRSKMPWYTVQYSSPVAGIKFIKEEWHFDNKPIVVVLNPQGMVENEDALIRIWEKGMRGFPFHFSFQDYYLGGSFFTFGGPGSDAVERYTFLCGGKDNRWIKKFFKKVNVVAEDLVIKRELISIELSSVEEGRKNQLFLRHYKTKKKTEFDSTNQEIREKLLSFKNESRWAMLTKWSTRVISDHGAKILKVLEAFEEWKVNVSEKGFENCFTDCHDKLLP